MPLAGRRKPGRSRKVEPDDARGHHAGDRYDDRGFPITARGELGPPGVRVRPCRPTAPFVETLASCLGCRRLVLVLDVAGEGASAWGMGPFERLQYGARLRLAGCDAGQDFADGCPRCGIAPHGNGDGG